MQAHIIDGVVHLGYVFRCNNTNNTLLDKCARLQASSWVQSFIRHPKRASPGKHSVHTGTRWPCETADEVDNCLEINS